jgi:hypothetical protein
MMTNSIFNRPPQPSRRSSPEADAAERRLESAVIGLRQATDSRGLRIMLYRGTSYTAECFRDALREITSATFSADRVAFLEDQSRHGEPGELTFAKHLQLLTNCYVAALEYERVALMFN